MEEIAHLLPDALPVALLRHDLGGNITFANRAFERETGLSLEALQGTAVSGLAHFNGEDTQAWTAALRTAAVTNTPASLEVVYHTAEGSRHYQVEVIPELPSTGGPAVSVLSILRNVTELRQSQAELQQTRQQMESQHAELLKVNGHLETFVYTAAHDLRSPVANLLVLTKLLMGNPKPEQQPVLIENMQQAVTRLDQTITGLVEVLEVQSTFHVAVQSTHFDQVLALAREELASGMSEVDVTLSSDFTACPRVTYIRAYLLSIFRSLLGNALKYRAEGRPLEVSITSGRDGEFVTLTFADNGIGIDLSRHAHKLFRPFSRLTTRGDGKGMGLHLVKNMVEKNGGKIEVASTAGRGSSFTVYLKEYTNSKETSL